MENEQVIQRCEKLEQLKNQGVDPYPARYKRTHSVADLAAKFNGLDEEKLRIQGTISCAGRLITVRGHGKSSFAHIYSNNHKIQIYARLEKLGAEKYEFFKGLDLGDFIGVSGALFRTRTDELTIDVGDFALLSKSLRPLPEKWHGLKDTETRYRQRYLDLLANPEVRRIFQTRSRIVQSIREFLNDDGFLEVETPMMQPIPGGATARPFMTHHNALDMELYLRIAPELYLKRLIVGGFERVYEINRNFRNEGLSREHNPEFTMLEFYQAYADFQQLMPITERMLAYIAESLGMGLKIPFGTHTIDLTPPWQRLTITDAILNFSPIKKEDLEDLGRARSIAEGLGIPLTAADGLGKVVTKIFEQVAEAQLIQPTFITHFPTEVSPLSKAVAENPSLVERFELFICGRELANGFSELNDPQEQRRRFEAQVAERAAGDEEAQMMDEDFIQALEYGMPPTAGEGIGIDRLVMLFTDSHSIREVILFPQMRKQG
ncbi:MAG: lysine--tRNA ligase [Candidatus Schekmanbacteria bacterium]|nr:lysine--tRNA ligase [Candidatus Schekmanbacteria bacterium]